MLRTKYPLAWSFHTNTNLTRHDVSAPYSPQTTPLFKEYPAAPLVRLPTATTLEQPLELALRARLSCRRFQATTLSMAALAALLQAGYGIYERIALGDDELLTRPVPSAGGLYPLELYCLARHVAGLDAGTYHYAPLDGQLELLDRAVLAEQNLSDLFLGQSYAAQAALILVITAVPERLLAKYSDRGYRLTLMEAGHVAQNLNLAAAALGLGALNLGGFLDLELAILLRLDPQQELPVYAMAIGHPQSPSPSELRLP